MSRFEDELRRDIPRGFEGGEDSASQAYWLPPRELSDWSYKNAEGEASGIFLGYRGGQAIGWDDDRHVLLCAGNRAGKGVSLIIPNLHLYDGSVIAIDPKGELAQLTYNHRKAKGQNCYALDPFGVSGMPKARFNPLDEIDTDSPNAVDDAASLAEALVITPPGTKDPHWTESARELIRALILLVLTFGPRERELIAVRQLITLDGPDFHGAGSPENKRKILFRMMQDCAQFPVVRRTGSAFEAIEDRELSGIFSTARSQTQFLDSPHMQEVLAAGSKPQFRLRDLKAKKTTIYLCLPASRMSEFARWLRLVINLALISFERENDIKPDVPVLVVMDEFPVLGHMQSVQNAAGQIAGFRVKLWVVLQDLTQIQRLYGKGWETFIGNTGVRMFFGNVDMTTCEYVSRNLGMRTMVIDEPSGANFSQRLAGASPFRQVMRQEPLLSPTEVQLLLARDKKRVLVFAAGKRPVILERAIYHDKADPLFGK